MASGSAGSTGASIRLISWAIGNPLVALTVVGLALYGFLRLDYSLFYGRFGVRPEEVGLGYGEILAQSVVGLLLWVVVWIVILLWFSRNVGFSNTVVRLFFRRGTLVTLLLVVIGVFVSVHFLRTALTTVAGVAVGMIIATVVPDLIRRERQDLQRRSSSARQPEQEPQRVVDLSREVNFRDPVFWRIVLRVILPAALVAVLVLTPIQAVQEATAVSQGQSAQQAEWGLPSLTWRADAASIFPIAGSLPRELDHVGGDCLMYLGQANGISIIYDVHTRQTLRIPTAAVVISMRPDHSSCDKQKCPLVNRADWMAFWTDSSPS